MMPALSLSTTLGTSSIGPAMPARRPAHRLSRTSLAAVSHDLKDPLASIEMALDFALEQEWTGDAGDAGAARATMALVRRQLAAAHRAAQRMRRLIVSTLDRVADAEPEEVPLELLADHAPATPAVSAGELLTEIVEQYGAAARARGVTLVHSCDASLPALRVHADAVLRALGNLLGNAVKFTPAGGRVTVGAAATPDGVTITIRDTGPGLPPDARRHLFRRFWQAPATAHLGSGAGLLIARMLVEEEGGTIGFRDAHDDAAPGAEFWITLPAEPTCR